MEDLSTGSCHSLANVSKGGRDANNTGQFACLSARLKAGTFPSFSRGASASAMSWFPPTTSLKSTHDITQINKKNLKGNTQVLRPYSEAKLVAL